MKYIVLFSIFISTLVNAQQIEPNCIEIFNELKVSVNETSGQRFYELGVHYYDVADIKDYQKAFCLLTVSAEKGIADSIAILGEFYEYGYFVKKDQSKAYNLAKEAEKKGSILALNSLGNYYLRGKGIQQDIQKGINYYIQAVKQGNLSISKLNLANAYFDGLGIPQDILKAIELTKEVLDDTTNSKKIQSIAMANLGGYYSYLERNNEAFIWTEKAAKLGNSTAETNLGFMYAFGVGVKLDQEKSLFWFNKAMSKNHSEAFYMMGWIYENASPVFESDIKKSVEFYKKAVELDHGMAKNNLANILFNGVKYPHDRKKALELYFSAAQDNNVAFSMFALYQIYAKGTKDIPQDLEKSRYWLKKAKENGFVPPE